MNNALNETGGPLWTQAQKQALRDQPLPFFALLRSAIMIARAVSTSGSLVLPPSGDE